MREAGLGEHVDAVKAGICPFCKEPIVMENFRDELSRKEFGISGLCQKCQDETFADPEEELLDTGAGLEYITTALKKIALPEGVMESTQIIISAAYDKRPESAGLNVDYGIGGCDLIFLLHGEKATISFVVQTHWYLPQNRQYKHDAYGQGLAYHAFEQQHEGQSKRESCEWLDGKPCFSACSGLAAHKLFETLVAKGSGGVWAKMTVFYEENFGKFTPRQKTKTENSGGGVDESI